MAELTDTETAILAFERLRWRYAGAKETAVRERFDMSAVRYYQVLGALIDRPEAWAYDPMLVKRLRGLREGRRRQRSGRRLVSAPPEYLESQWGKSIVGYCPRMHEEADMALLENLKFELAGRFEPLESDLGKTHLSVRYEPEGSIVRVGACITAL